MHFFFQFSFLLTSMTKIALDKYLQLPFMFGLLLRFFSLTCCFKRRVSNLKLLPRVYVPVFADFNRQLFSSLLHTGKVFNCRVKKEKALSPSVFDLTNGGQIFDSLGQNDG